MCGIVGIANANSKSIERSVLERMNRAIAHRGPDDDGFYVSGNVGLAMRRLAIIDVACGKQPIYNRDKTKWIVFNGEIYNYQELRADLEKQGDEFYTHSDTETILHLYERYGVDCVKHLRGMFALAIWDETEKTLFVARDRIGKKPVLYSHRKNGDLIFGSEFTALLAHPDIGKAIDYQAINHYLSYQCVPAPLTAYEEIRKLEPGHWLKWKNGEVKIERYWQPDFHRKIKITDREAEDETLRLLREATEMRMISEVPLGAFLSGGVDSSTVVALMAEKSSAPVKTFSIGFEEQDYSELKYARQVAAHVGAEHHEFIVKPDAVEILPTLVEHYGEPYADSSAIAAYYVSKETSKYVTVALNGDGGDESFAGYERYFAMRWAEKYNKIPKLLRRALIETLVNALPASEMKRRSPAQDLKKFVKAASLPKVERYFEWSSAFDRAAKENFYTADFNRKIDGGADSADFLARAFAQSNGGGIIDATMFADQMTYLPNDLLVKVDIASMANSLEARSPFLDHKVIEFAASLPERVKIRGAETKYLLKKVASKVVPREVLYRKKMGFGVPLNHWFRGEMKDFLRANLLSERFARREIVKSERVKKIVEEHTSGARDHVSRLWTLLMLELWFQKFID